ncbi:AsnC family transcriptional regulator [Geotalea uraniireducens]|uniref:AsnC family transcriptional regulator n=1 Tax=Geotalea uraniireducens TaxID=351604 RepID=A0ABN6VZ24_9BACT|nr:Lrp/AsnC family transcriptional regulator [Geotalea uraniireducens]BDV44621.1 AsnC family transcriptional regulator [Geotalea uraniireducens]
MQGLDDNDLKILELLQRDGRATHAAVGKAVGLSAPSVYARIQRLEKSGVIRGYAAQLDPAGVGRGLAAFVRVTTRAITASEEQDEFERFVLAEPLILECHDVDGEDSYILKVRAATLESLRDLLARIRGIAAVSRTVTSIGMVTIKEEGVAPLPANGPGASRGKRS